MIGQTMINVKASGARTPISTFLAGVFLYRVSGELFFASSNDLYSQFDYAGDPEQVVIDLSTSHVWDASTVATLDAIETKYAGKGKRVEIHGLNDASASMHGRLSGHLAAS